MIHSWLLHHNSFRPSLVYSEHMLSPWCFHFGCWLYCRLWGLISCDKCIFFSNLLPFKMFWILMSYFSFSSTFTGSQFIPARQLSLPTYTILTSSLILFLLSRILSHSICNSSFLFGRSKLLIQKFNFYTCCNSNYIMLPLWSFSPVISWNFKLNFYLNYHFLKELYWKWSMIL